VRVRSWQSLGFGVGGCAYYAVHAFECLDISVVVGFVKLVLSTPGCGGTVLFVCGLGNVGAGAEKTSRL